MTSENIQGMSDDDFAASLIHFRIAEMVGRNGKKTQFGKAQIYKLSHGKYVFYLFHGSSLKNEKVRDIVFVRNNELKSIVFETCYFYKNKDFVIKNNTRNKLFYSDVRKIYEVQTQQNFA